MPVAQTTSGILKIRGTDDVVAVEHRAREGFRMTARRLTESYRITTGDGRSTEELVEAGEYGSAHSCLTSENFPARHFEG